MHVVYVPSINVYLLQLVWAGVLLIGSSSFSSRIAKWHLYTPAWGLIAWCPPAGHYC